MSWGCLWILCPHRGISPVWPMAVNHWLPFPGLGMMPNTLVLQKFINQYIPTFPRSPVSDGPDCSQHFAHSISNLVICGSSFVSNPQSVYKGGGLAFLSDATWAQPLPPPSISQYNNCNKWDPPSIFLIILIPNYLPLLSHDLSNTHTTWQPGSPASWHTP